MFQIEFDADSVFESEYGFTKARAEELAVIFLKRLVKTSKLTYVKSRSYSNNFSELEDYVYNNFTDNGRFIQRHVPNRIVDVIPELDIDQEEGEAFASLLGRYLLEHLKKAAAEMKQLASAA